MSESEYAEYIDAVARKLEGPFTYASGWQGFYDPAEGRYLGMNDIYMPRDFDPATGRSAFAEETRATQNLVADMEREGLL